MDDLNVLKYSEFTQKYNTILSRLQYYSETLRRLAAGLAQQLGLWFENDGASAVAVFGALCGNVKWYTPNPPVQTRTQLINLGHILLCIK